MKDKTFEEIVFPQSGVLHIDKDQNATAFIVDEELDPYDCSFGNDGCVVIDTSEYNNIVLNRQHLNTLKRLINQAEKHYDKVYGNSPIGLK